MATEAERSGLRLAVVLDPALSGPENMQRDLALLADAEQGKASARVYTWDRAWVSLGRFQHESVLRVPVPWVLRPTGGRAVLHGHDVTVGMAMPLIGDHRSVRTAYRRAIAPILRGLRAVGVAAALGEDTRFAGKTPRSADCFAHVAANDIVDERTGQKVCGCALRLTGRAVLVQASIPAGPPLLDPEHVFGEAGAVCWSSVNPAALAEAMQGTYDP